MSTPGYYQLLGSGAFIALFCIGFIAQSIRIGRGKPWWDKLLTGVLCFIVVALIGGLGLTSFAAVVQEVEHQEPHIPTPAIPRYWWK